MGLFRVLGKVTRENDCTEDIDLLVDTGATYLTLPADVARRLGLRTLREQVILTADGRQEVWPVAEVRISVEGREAPAFRSASIRSRGASSPSTAL